MQSPEIWARIAEQGFSIFVMALFAYICYTYFNKKSKEDWERFDKEKQVLLEIIEKKDAELSDKSQQLLDMTKLNIESWANLMSTINKLTQKIDKIN